MFNEPPWSHHRLAFSNRFHFYNARVLCARTREKPSDAPSFLLPTRRHNDMSPLLLTMVLVEMTLTLLFILLVSMQRARLVVVSNTAMSWSSSFSIRAFITFFIREAKQKSARRSSSVVRGARQELMTTSHSDANDIGPRVTVEYEVHTNLINCKKAMTRERRHEGKQLQLKYSQSSLTSAVVIFCRRS